MVKVYPIETDGLTRKLVVIFVVIPSRWGLPKGLPNQKTSQMQPYYLEILYGYVIGYA